MTWEPKAGPAAAHGVIAATLGGLRGHRSVAALLETAHSLWVSKPIEVVTADVDGDMDLRAAEALAARARHVGWRFLLEAGDRAAFIDIYDLHDAVRCAQLAFGRPAKRFVDKLEAAQPLVAAGPAGLDVCALDLPDLHRFAIWLRHPDPANDTFIRRRHSGDALPRPETALEFRSELARAADLKQRARR